MQLQALDIHTESISGPRSAETLFGRLLQTEIFVCLARASSEGKLESRCWLEEVSRGGGQRNTSKKNVTSEREKKRGNLPWKD